MAQSSGQLDGVFQALADPTRRAVLARLGAGSASIGELAAPFDMALPSFMKHIRYLQDTGWITTRKTGRVRICALVPKSFDDAEAWLSDQRRLWEARTDRLEHFVTTTQDVSTRPDKEAST
ncbi:metalloregulator ArsR/SmtB family transcription factor [Arthrobacter sp. NPDC089319]|uniref:ArsR/SmtB family transcription factor n=1 Tax=Arthrobacter sp. NPDC089319 TaxID=3155915 RepID=UPI003419A270